MEDFDHLSAECFDVYQFVNYHCKSTASNYNKEVTVAALVSRLQIYVERVNSSLEKSSLQFVSTMSQAIKEIDMMLYNTRILMEKRSNLRIAIINVHRDTEEYMANLEHKDAIFKKLQLARHAMQESDSWGKVIVELDEILEQNDTNGSKDKFCILKKSLCALKHMSGHAEREAQLEYYKNKIEILATPSVAYCFQTGNITQCVNLANLFKIIDRFSQLKLSYRAIHKNNLIRKWQRCSETQSGTDVIVRFYKFLKDFIEDQQQLCEVVFNDVSEIIDTLSETLIDLRYYREYFTNNLLEKANNINKKIGDATIHQDRLDCLNEAIFSYFNVFVEHYPDMEAAHAKEFIKGMYVKNADPTEIIRHLENYNASLVRTIDDTFERCVVITRKKYINQIYIMMKNTIDAYIGVYFEVQKMFLLNEIDFIDWNMLQYNINLMQLLGDLLRIITYFENKYSLVNPINDSTINRANALTVYNFWQGQLFNSADKAVMVVEEKNSELFFSLRNVGNIVHGNIVKIILLAIENHFLQMDFSRGETVDLPDCSFVPQEYITQVGQYLLTLPQHLEPLLLIPSDSLKSILCFCENAYGEGKACADILLNLIVEEITKLYINKIDGIASLSLFGAKQLAVDIEYFGNVLEEMGILPKPDLQQIKALLKMPLEQYNILSIGYNFRLVTMIRQKRNIISR
ncbi:conserved oligomeric Golgi complex subunit 7 isoform X2 [Wyeomyia smithii]|uniref:conserved oligomeric Golgi complex subunit 7 isoform X2 n=1 Tax=Wyeomyia smithii TaxID=174621 RepID=UPI002467E2A5|nr:conserved oligomeric Golgi complex subunit 7 isoform X2 [Wyeomyia smithii]